MNPLNWLGYQDPSEAANKYTTQIPDAASKHLNPYISAGMGAMDTANASTAGAVNDPTARYNDWAGKYKSSAGYKFALDQAMQAGNNAEAAGGMSGTGQHVLRNQTTATGLASQDFNNYMNKIESMYNTGLQGQTQIMNNGYGASTNMANTEADTLTQLAEDAAGGQRDYNRMLTSGITTAAQIAAAFYGIPPTPQGVGEEARNYYDKYNEPTQPTQPTMPRYDGVRNEYVTPSYNPKPLPLDMGVNNGVNNALNKKINYNDPKKFDETAATNYFNDKNFLEMLYEILSNHY